MLRNLVGYGPLEPLLADDDVWEILVNAPHGALLNHEYRIAGCGGAERSGCPVCQGGVRRLRYPII